MDKDSIVRTIIAIGLCLVFFVVWNMFFVKPTPAPDAGVATQSQQDGTLPESATTVAPPVSATVTTEPPIVLQTADYEVAFDSSTGDIRYVSLDAFKGTDDLAPRFMRIDDKNANYAKFNAGIASGYVAETTKAANGATVLTFTAESEQLRVSKQYTITDGSYEIPMSIAVTNLSSAALSVPTNVQIGTGLGEGFDSASYVFAGPIIGNSEDNEKKVAEKVKDTISLANPQWGGYTSKYFLFAFMSNAFDNAQIIKQDASAITQLSGTLTVPAGESSSISDGKLFVGPKYYNPLNAYDIGIQKTIDYGIFFFLGIPMAKLMNFFYGFVKNYGIAIIFLTIIVKLLTLPLTLKSMKSMKAMSRMQPEVMALREKYKGDPQRMNAATMELYKKHGANPVSGCLPMLIQLPVFVALYNALLVSIELRGAPFFGWITDLSLKDPYYITPIIMGASMFITQKMTPTTADPTQQKIMLIMPIVFTFMFLNFPAGLVVYWLTNNILSIIQQFIINKQTPKPAVAAK